jgi:hypothetical protein
VDRESVSQEKSAESSLDVRVEKFPRDKFSSNFRIDGAGNRIEVYADRPSWEPERRRRSKRIWISCANCSWWFAADSDKRYARRFCTRACCTAHATATGKFKGESNPRWLGGESNDNMRYRNRQKERHPLQEAARRAVQVAIKNGSLVRQPCEQCRATPAEGHHDDYNKPLDVRWLCRACHTAHHKAERAA